MCVTFFARILGFSQQSEVQKKVWPFKEKSLVQNSSMKSTIFRRREAFLNLLKVRHKYLKRELFP